VQIEYALNAVAAGATSLGISATDGVVIATEKKLPSMLVDESTVQKITILSPNIGMVYSGMGPDYRVLVRKARKTAQAYFRLYHEQIPVAQLVREVAAVMQEFTRAFANFGGRSAWGLAVCCAVVLCLVLRAAVAPVLQALLLKPFPAPSQHTNSESGGVRPFGVSLLLAGYDDNGPQLYQIDPSGSYFAWKASAIGKNMNNAKTFLEKRYSDEVRGGRLAAGSPMAFFRRGRVKRQSGGSFGKRVTRCRRLCRHNSRTPPTACIAAAPPPSRTPTSNHPHHQPPPTPPSPGRHRGRHPHRPADPEGGLRGPGLRRQHRGRRHRARPEVQGAERRRGAGLPAGGGVTRARVLCGGGVVLGSLVMCGWSSDFGGARRACVEVG